MASGETLDAVRESAQTINDVTTYACVGTVALITLDSPPVNALGSAVRQGLMAAFARAAADPEAHAVVLACAGRTFIAGADIREFDAPDPDAPDLLEVLAQIDACPKPTVAAIHGTALGGGLETALCCHTRVATPSAKVGLPEVALGLLPGAGGTQRLPRIVGAQTALEMMVFGKPVIASRAHEIGLIDAIIEGDLLEGAIAFAENAAQSGPPPVPVRERSEGLSLPHDAELFARFRADTPAPSKATRRRRTSCAL